MTLNTPRRDAFTLVELIVSITLATMVLTSMSGILQVALKSSTAMVDSSDLDAQTAQALRTVRHLLKSAVEPPTNRYRMSSFQNLPSGWNERHWGNNNRYAGAFQFFADVDQDGSLEWVWIWVDPVGGAGDPRADITPKPPYLKVTAFRRYPTWPGSWANYNHAFYRRINDDPRTYYILASNLTEHGTQQILNRNNRVAQGFGMDPLNGNERMDVILSSHVDRNLSAAMTNRIDSTEPVVFLREQVFMPKYMRPYPVDPDPRFQTNNQNDVRDSCFPMNGSMGRRLFAR